MPVSSTSFMPPPEPLNGRCPRNACCKPPNGGRSCAHTREGTRQRIRQDQVLSVARSARHSSKSRTNLQHGAAGYNLPPPVRSTPGWVQCLHRCSHNDSRPGRRSARTSHTIMARWRAPAHAPTFQARSPQRSPSASRCPGWRSAMRILTREAKRCPRRRCQTEQNDLAVGFAPVGRSRRHS